MARSRRRTPITGMTTAESDKGFKVKEHRRERVALRALDISSQEPQSSKVFGNPWRGDKDGKQRFDPAMYPQLMRK
ncbi:hypothetical protein [Sinorhizobium meliloti]|uniref:hypothetical protein n=2 Tax=Rhizobium meliloti TaxID=382 RepID=UPI0002A59441|nr:hypothetical protein [Sinorhizobium meliloti]AGA08976.1 hypothetical protein C770_GR4pC0243 [Sinorhizobium meliloti GR4]MDE3819602.1 hypothetical protein [Sinorhizobium meliloti]